jgi:hypothetical protein
MKEHDLEKKFEVEHTLIDFRMMIIGAKINAAVTDDEKYTLNKTELAALMQRDDDNMQFYMTETI